MNENVPRMMTVRQVARTGLLSEHALRLMLKAGKLPAIFVGNKALINYDRLCEQLSIQKGVLGQSHAGRPGPS